MVERAIFLAAGGTGGHLFPAQALSSALGARGYEIELITDDRGHAFGDSFPARAIHIIASATPTSQGLIRKMSAIGSLLWGMLCCLVLFMRQRPLCVVGFGGYPTVPPIVAAWLLRIPCFVHEQNAVMGRANAFLARFVDGIATGFTNRSKLPAGVRAHVHYSGNPVRPAVLAAAQKAYVSDFTSFRILVTGGSQGARIMSDVVPAAIGLLSDAQRAQLAIVQQARGEDEARVRDLYAQLHVRAQVAPFFSNLPDEIARAHLVIARSGASTVSELAVIGRPSVLVPFPHALDQDQAMNARYLEAQGAAQVIAQSDFTPAWLADYLSACLARPDDLSRAAEAARLAGKPDAAEDLASFIIRAIAGPAQVETRI
jgi:UDP-N-acetylglucosamine--N-acetylmuramyl-(pentapeptide) pyrophosphoryl-undecaprenol N-acetylglucosamine transferase